MENDLKYPSGLIAEDYEELPISDKPAGVGSMPGKPLQEVKEDRLISGRGCVP